MLVAMANFRAPAKKPEQDPEAYLAHVLAPNTDDRVMAAL
jgi:hypothetical protein